MLATQFRSFYAVATTGSFTSGARLLNVSQPTVTTQVRSLEEYYGVELFYRHARGAQLTEVGKQLLAISQRIVDNQNEASDYLNNVGKLQTGTLRISAIGSFQVTEILSAFSARHPKVNVLVTHGNSRQLQEDLRNYKADVAVVGQIGSLDEFYEIHYSRPEIIIIVDRQHPWAGRTAIRIEELEGQPIISREEGSETRRVLEEAAAHAGVELVKVMEFDSRDGVVAAVARCIGIGAMSNEEFVDQNLLCMIRVSNADMYTEAHVICLKDRHESRIIRAFMEIAADMVKVPKKRSPRQSTC
ncbi:MAG: LysR substrate-binding domain-containing protein [Rhodospirillales bacterium]